MQIEKFIVNLYSVMVNNQHRECKYVNFDRPLTAGAVRFQMNCKRHLIL